MSKIYSEILNILEKDYPELYSILMKEYSRVNSSLNMIASENYPSLEILLLKSVPLFEQKYSEGSVGHRYYGGCENVDELEILAEQEANELFGSESAYLQPHSGSDANLIAYNAILEKEIITPFLRSHNVKNINSLSDEDFNELRNQYLNQKLLAPSMETGGHLTHGSRQNISSKIFHSISYDLYDEIGNINYGEIEEKALKEKPLIILAGYSACPRKLDFERLRKIADKAGSILMADMAHFAGLVAGKIFTGVYNPVPYADVITFTFQKTLRGIRHGGILCKKDFESFIKKGCPGVIGGPNQSSIFACYLTLKEALSDKFKIYAQQIVKNAQALAKKLVDLEVPILTNGTDNHMVIIDVRKYGITGKQAEDMLAEIGITCNRNTIPNDPNGAWKTSGIRLGTPALTTLGMNEKDMEKIAVVISSVLNSALTIDENTKESSKEFARNIVDDLLSKYKVYPSLLRE